MRNIYRLISRLLPRNITEKLVGFLRYSSIKKDYDVFIGFVTFTSVFSGLLVGIFSQLIFKRFFFVFFFGIAILINGFAYLSLLFVVDKKARFIEASLPDALQLMASNLRAGMTPERALLLSSRPEFGPLKEEIDYIGREVALGKNIGVALLDMAHRVRSRRLLRSIELINAGLGSGGSLAMLLEATAAHVREQFLVDKKIKAAITIYVIFIFSAAAIITPVLLGLSSILVEILRSSLGQIDIPQSAVASLPIKISEINISSSFLFNYIIIYITANCFFAALLLGLIQKGKQRDGLKYFVPMILLGIPIFWLARTLIQTLLSGLFQF